MPSLAFHMYLYNYVMDKVVNPGIVTHLPGTAQECSEKVYIARFQVDNAN
jgi:hypothetical protein